MANVAVAQLGRFKLVQDFLSDRGVFWEDSIAIRLEKNEDMAEKMYKF